MMPPELSSPRTCQKSEFLPLAAARYSSPVNTEPERESSQWPIIKVSSGVVPSSPTALRSSFLRTSAARSAAAISLPFLL